MDDEEEEYEEFRDWARRHDLFKPLTTKNLREIKLVYATLAESFKGNGNKRVNESKGQASKPVASTEPKKEVLSEGAEMKNRFKKLANLI